MIELPKVAFIFVVTADPKPGHTLLESLPQVLAPGALLALATTKDTKPAHPVYTPLGKLKLSKRLVTFLKLGE
jgi:hypothetical protein